MRGYDPNGPNHALTVRRNLRKPWDTFFLPGYGQYDRRAEKMKLAARKAGFEVVVEYLRDTPAPGLSGVMLTRLPEGSPPIPSGHRMITTPLAGL